MRLLVFFVVVALSAPAPADACIRSVPDQRFLQTQAPAGGVFFVHGEVDEDAVLIDSAGTSFPVEIVSRADPSVAIRAPRDAAPGPISLDGASLYDRDLILEIVDGEAVDEPPPELRIASIRIEETRVPSAPLVAVPGDECGRSVGVGHEYWSVFEGHIDILADSRPLVVDVWRTEEGVQVDELSERWPLVAGLEPLGDGPQLREIPGGGAVVVGYVGPGVQLVHVRVRDPRTGLASEFATIPMSVPVSARASVGCSAADLPRSTTLPLIALLLLGLANGRRRRG